jgi:hypothetical protein
MRTVVIRTVALFLGNTLPWHIPAPLGVPRRIVRPSWALKAATEALVGVRLDDGDLRIDLAACTLALDIAATIIAPTINAVILAGPANVTVRPIAVRIGTATVPAFLSPSRCGSCSQDGKGDGASTSKITYHDVCLRAPSEV